MLERADQMNTAPLELLKHFGALVVPSKPDHSSRHVIPAAPSAKTLRLLSAGLARLSADCHYDTWLQICIIVFHASGGTEEGFDCLNAWSSTGEKYEGERDVRKKWASFRLDHPRPLTMGTLVWMVKAAGHDWADVCAVAEGDAFEVVEMEAQ